MMKIEVLSENLKAALKELSAYMGKQNEPKFRFYVILAADNHSLVLSVHCGDKLQSIEIGAKVYDAGTIAIEFSRFNAWVQLASNERLVLEYHHQAECDHQRDLLQFDLIESYCFDVSENLYHDHDFDPYEAVQDQLWFDCDASGEFVHPDTLPYDSSRYFLYTVDDFGRNVYIPSRNMPYSHQIVATTSDMLRKLGKSPTQTIPPYYDHDPLDHPRFTAHVSIYPESKRYAGRFIDLLSSDDFPAIEAHTWQPIGQVNGDSLISAIVFTSKAMAKEVTRPVLHGIHLRFMSDVLECTGANGYMLNQRRIDLHNFSQAQLDITMSLPKKLTSLKPLFAGLQVDLFLNDAGDQIKLLSANGKLILSLIQGNFPDYQALIDSLKPDEYQPIRVGEYDLARAIKQLKPYWQDSENAIRFSWDFAHDLILAARSQEKGDNEISVQNGNPERIGDQVRFASFDAELLLASLDNPPAIPKKLKSLDSINHGEFVYLYLSTRPTDEGRYSSDHRSQPMYLHKADGGYSLIMAMSVGDNSKPVPTKQAEPPVETIEPAKEDQPMPTDNRILLTRVLNEGQDFWQLTNDGLSREEKNTLMRLGWQITHNRDYWQKWHIHKPESQVINMCDNPTDVNEVIVALDTISLYDLSTEALNLLEVWLKDCHRTNNRYLSDYHIRYGNHQSAIQELIAGKFAHGTINGIYWLSSASSHSMIKWLESTLSLAIQAKNSTHQAEDQSMREIYYLMAGIGQTDRRDNQIAYALPHLLVDFLAQCNFAATKIWSKSPQGKDWSDPAVLLPRDHQMIAPFSTSVWLALNREEYQALLSLADFYDGFPYIYECRPDLINPGDPRQLMSIPTAKYPAQKYDYSLASWAYSIEQNTLIPIDYDPCVKIHFNDGKRPLCCKSILGESPWSYGANSDKWPEFIAWVNQSPANWVCVDQWASATQAVIWDEVDYLELIDGETITRIDPTPAADLLPEDQPEKPKVAAWKKTAVIALLVLSLNFG